MSDDKVYYTGVVLDDLEIKNLRDSLDDALDSFYESMDTDEYAQVKQWVRSNINPTHGHEQLNHHMTIYAKPADEEVREDLGKELKLTIDGFGIDPELKVAAWRVKSPISVESGVPHITALLGPSGKVFNSKNIKVWVDLVPFDLVGKLQEVTSKK